MMQTPGEHDPAALNRAGDDSFVAEVKEERGEDANCRRDGRVDRVARDPRVSRDDHGVICIRYTWRYNDQACHNRRRDNPQLLRDTSRLMSYSWIRRSRGVRAGESGFFDKRSGCDEEGRFPPVGESRATSKEIREQGAPPL